MFQIIMDVVIQVLMLDYKANRLKEEKKEGGKKMKLVSFARAIRMEKHFIFTTGGSEEAFNHYSQYWI